MSNVRAWLAARRSPAGLTVLSALVLLAVAVALSLSRLGAAAPGPVPSPTPDRAAYAPRVYNPPEAAPSLSLVDSSGNRFTMARLAGRVVLLNFGYTNCPDVCPTTLAINRDVVLARPDRVASVFVTVDPERDTPASLASYLTYFGAPMTGLSGTAAETAAAASAWGVFYQKGPVNQGGGYAMSHTAGTFVLDTAGRLRFFYPYGTPAVLFVETIDELTR